MELEGGIRRPLRAPSFPFNDFTSLRIPRKSLKFLTLLFSILTTTYQSIQHKIATSNQPGGLSGD